MRKRCGYIVVHDSFNGWTEWTMLIDKQEHWIWWFTVEIAKPLGIHIRYTAFTRTLADGGCGCRFKDWHRHYAYDRINKPYGPYSVLEAITYKCYFLILPTKAFCSHTVLFCANNIFIFLEKFEIRAAIIQNYLKLIITSGHSDMNIFITL